MVALKYLSPSHSMYIPISSSNFYYVVDIVQDTLRASKFFYLLGGNTHFYVVAGS